MTQFAELSDRSPVAASSAQAQAHAQLGTAVELRDFGLHVAGRPLLENANARFDPGKITLIVGPSGAGKSLLLRAISGLVADDQGPISVSGDVIVGNGPSPAENRLRQVGVVFQHFALFDELSPAENVRFAFAHRRAASGDEPAVGDARPEYLLDELDVPRRVRTASLSGGQRQRLAIARTLANNPKVVLYDEPTSGLDRATAARVARLIQSTHANHPTTSVIVTHDYESLVPIADHVYLFDPSSRSLQAIDRSQWSRLHELLEEQSRNGTTLFKEPAVARQPWFRRVAAGLTAFLNGTSRAVEQALLLPVRLLPAWRSVPWGLRFFLHYLRLVAGPSAWVYVLVAGAITAFVATYFTFRFLPYRSYTEPLIIENLLNGLGLSLYRILVPVLVTILIAARCGAAVASDVGAKVYGHQVDAMNTLNAPSARYIYTGILYAFLIGTPFLVLLAFLAAQLTSVIVFCSTHPQYGPYFWDTHFHRELTIPNAITYRGTYWLLAKVLLCAAGTAMIAYYFGSKPKHSGKDVSSGITATILWSTLIVLAVHCLFAFYEFEQGARGDSNPRYLDPQSSALDRLATGTIFSKIGV